LFSLNLSTDLFFLHLYLHHLRWLVSHVHLIMSFICSKAFYGPHHS
jgi:hypothetical protein